MKGTIDLPVENNGKRKYLFSLRKQISRLILGLCVIVSAAWFTILTVNIFSYQKENDENRLHNLEEYAEVLDNSIIQLNDVVGNIFTTNVSFDHLNQYRTSVEEVDLIYNLLNLMQIQVRSNKNLSGLFIYYDNLKKTLYYVNENMNFQVQEELKKAGKVMGKDTIAGTSVYENIMYVQPTSEDTYFNVFMKKTKAAISGSISLKAGLPLDLESSAAYGVVYKDKFYRIAGSELDIGADELDLLEPGKNWLENRVVYTYQLEMTDMSVVEVLPITPWLHMSGIHMFMAFLGIIFIILCTKLYHFISIELTRPLEDMNNALSKIQTGEWEVHFDASNRVEEIENVRNAVQVMLKEIEDYKIKSYEEQLEKQETELQYLRLQLAPHFYTNCLKNAYYMLMLKEYDNVERYLLCLSTHLRYLLQKNVQMVELNKEKDFVLNYIELQKLMTEKKLTLDMQIDENVLDMEVPILLLQTFVENSIKYGRETEQTDLRIQIRIRRRMMEYGECLDISICDNGHGYPEEILAALNQKEVSQEQKFGVGVINLQHRMKICYGENVRWYFSNADGACSDLIIPVSGGR